MVSLRLPDYVVRARAYERLQLLAGNPYDRCDRAWLSVLEKLRFDRVNMEWRHTFQIDRRTFPVAACLYRLRAILGVPPVRVDSNLNCAARQRAFSLDRHKVAIHWFVGNGRGNQKFLLR